MNIEREKFFLRHTDAGYVPVPCGTETSLLRRLYGSLDPSEPLPASPVKGSTLPECLARIRDVAKGRGVGVSVRQVRGECVVTLTDLAARSAAAAVDLSESLRARGMEVACRWMGDGDVVLGSRTLLRVKRSLRAPSEAAIAKVIEQIAARFPDPASTYFNLPDLLEKNGDETPWRFGRSLYKYTACGPWVVFRMPEGTKDVYYEDDLASQSEADQAWWARCTGVAVGSIVEGSDVEVGPTDLAFPFTAAEWDKAVEGINDEADFYWHRDNDEVFVCANAAGDHVLWATVEGFESEPRIDEALEEVEEIQVALAQAAWAALNDVRDAGGDEFEAQAIPAYPGYTASRIDQGDMTY